ncbi:MAG: acyl-CoA thioester hydrolase [Thermoleophilaceae bacterium]|nr:acyl-CoA thioester hydrolase [Thermoleophilaceae bacterium]
MSEPFSLTERVRFGDLDAMQHLNNVQFLRYFETARIQYMTTLFPEHKPTSQQQFGFIFAECKISYRSPAYYGEEIRIGVWPKKIGNASLHLTFEMHAMPEERLVAEGYGVLVGFDYTENRSHPLPDHVRERLAQDIRE